MHEKSPHPPKVAFFGLSVQSFDQLVSSWGWPGFRAGQVREWVYGKLVGDPAQMSNLSKMHREVLNERVEFVSARMAGVQSSRDGTRKHLLVWEDQGSAEAVMIPEGQRRTACVSSQFGCPVGCKFCASGIGGVKGNLVSQQMVEQVFVLNRVLGQAKQRITHVVFMGTGEPLANYHNVMEAIRILHEEGFNIGARRMTISTVGVPERIRELANEGLAINLAISLHAPNEKLRRELIPWAEHFSVHEILDAARYYFERTGREITLEYILLAGVNDKSEHARQLVKLCRTVRGNVNLIRYNPVAGVCYQSPATQDVLRFQGILREGGINAQVRKSRGRDIDAACGQLRRREQDAAGCGAEAEDGARSGVRVPRGFSLVELLVVLAIVVILISIFVPYLMKVRERSNRMECAENLRRIASALANYANANQHVFPRVRYDAVGMPVGYRCYSGAEAGNPFSSDSEVGVNDVTASLWLLIRGGYIHKEGYSASSVFICPGSRDRADGMSERGELRSNFRGSDNLSYSYASPFSNATRYGLIDVLPARFVLMADKNPGTGGKADDVTRPAHDAPRLEMVWGNSNNHKKAGQNVLYADMHVDFVNTPYCGVGGDNIYTALARKPIFTGIAPVLNSKGYCSAEIGPAWESDSYLVPTEADR